jgi:serine/threonine-protein kinase
MASFEIPDPASTVTLKSEGPRDKVIRAGAVAFTVTNRTAQPLSGRLKVAPRSDAKAEWFTVEGERERPFAPSETQKVTVSVSIPPEVTTGDFGFRLQALNVNDPGNDYAESAIITLALPAVDKKKNRWLPWAIAAALLVVVGGVAAWKLWPKPAAPVAGVPNLSDGTMKYPDAERKLKDGHPDLTVVRVAGEATGKPPETVISQTPKAGQPFPGPHDPITLTVDPGIPFPPVKGVPWSNEVARQLADFEVRSTVLFGRTDHEDRFILETNPQPGQAVAKKGPVFLVITRRCLNEQICRRLDVIGGVLRPPSREAHP